MCAIEIIRLIGKEFTDVPDSELEKWIEIVRPMVSKKKFGKLYEQALALLVCHRLKLNGEGSDEDGLGSIADSLRVSSYSEGSRSVSFGGANVLSGTSDAELGMTVYGMQFVDLRRMVIVPITIAGVEYDGC